METAIAIDVDATVVVRAGFIIFPQNPREKRGASQGGLRGRFELLGADDFMGSGKGTLARECGGGVSIRNEYLEVELKELWSVAENVVVVVLVGSFFKANGKGSFNKILVLGLLLFLLVLVLGLLFLLALLLGLLLFLLALLFGLGPFLLLLGRLPVLLPLLLDLFFPHFRNCFKVIRQVLGSVVRNSNRSILVPLFFHSLLVHLEPVVELCNWFTKSAIVTRNSRSRLA
mmetsp:Transcript_7919/g.20727  ORF Transcript_7919/g.20727 Transcript_7919/m.20727 type:complete len:230 (+) Transcript_7919:156-845(+)